jgi:hypothetical protein
MMPGAWEQVSGQIVARGSWLRWEARVLGATSLRCPPGGRRTTPAAVSCRAMVSALTEYRRARAVRLAPSR